MTIAHKFFLGFALGIVIVASATGGYFDEAGHENMSWNTVVVK